MNGDMDQLMAKISQDKDCIELGSGRPVVTKAPVILAPLPMGPSKTVTQCPHCQSTVETSIKHTTTARTHLLAILCWFTCCCCCLPYCLDSTRNMDHYCPQCKRYLGTYQK